MGSSHKGAVCWEKEGSRGLVELQRCKREAEKQFRQEEGRGECLMLRGRRRNFNSISSEDIRNLASKWGHGILESRCHVLRASCISNPRKDEPW